MKQIIVMAHGKAQEAFDRHLPMWEKHGLPITVLCPEDDPVRSRYTTLCVAKAEHNGKESVKRLMRLLEECARPDREATFVFEYDSFCLGELPETGGFRGNLMPETFCYRFGAPRYATPPWSFCQWSAALMLRKAKDFPCVLEEGEADRWLSYIANLAGVPILHHDPKGFSAVWIRGDNIDEARLAISEGATMIHGVKQHEWLEQVRRAYDARNTPIA